MAVKILVASGNKEVLSSVQSGLADEYKENWKVSASKNDLYGDPDQTVIVCTNSYDDLTEISQDTSIFSGIMVMHDEKHPLETKEKKGWFFGKSNKQNAAALADKFYNVNTQAHGDVATIRSEVKAFIKTFRSFEELLDQIKHGEIKVEWQEWTYSGEGDSGEHRFNLIKDGEMRGMVFISPKEKSIRFDDMQFSNSSSSGRNNVVVGSMLEETVRKAWIRDDTDFVAMVTVDGTVKLPEGNYDIRRKEIIDGIWSV